MTTWCLSRKVNPKAISGGNHTRQRPSARRNRPRTPAGSLTPFQTASMTVKDKVLKAVQDLPDDASIEDAMELLLFLAKIEKGLTQAAAGQTLSHDEVKKRLSRWLK